MMWCIYLLRCVTTDKLYVGQTKQTVWQRWRAHVRDALYRRGRIHCPALTHAIRKHGASDFEIYLLEECGSQDEANTLERAWIAELRCLAPVGYNLDDGGKTTTRHPDTLIRIGERSRAAWASLTTEQRAILSERKREAALRVANETGDRVRRAWAVMTQEKRSEIARKRWINRTDRSGPARSVWLSLSDDERNRRLSLLAEKGLQYNSSRTPEQHKSASVVMVAARRAAVRARSHIAIMMSLHGRCMATVHVLSGPHKGEIRKVRRGVYKNNWSPQVWISLDGHRPRITGQVPKS